MNNLIVVPAYNEEEALPGTLASLEALPADFEVLVVDDGSQDGTGRIAEHWARRRPARVHVLHLPANCGIGAAVQAGYLFAAGQRKFRYVIQFDADGQHDAADLPALVAECEARGLDLCVGSRFLAGGAGGDQSTPARRLGGRLLSWLIGALARTRVTDSTSGLRCAGPRAWSHFATHYPSDFPEPESLFWCARNGLRVGEVSVSMHERQGGVSSIRSWKALFYMMKVTLAILLDSLRPKEVTLS